MKKFFNDQQGQGLAEYALIVGLIVAVGVAAWAMFKPTIESKVSQIISNLEK